MIKFRNVARKHRILMIVAIALTVCVILGTGLYLTVVSLVLSRDYQPDLVLTYPDGQYELLICEWFYTVGGGSELYLRKTGQDKWYNSWRKTKIGTTSAETLSFAKGNYYVDWQSHCITVCYYQGYDIENVNDPSTWRGMVQYELG